MRLDKYELYRRAVQDPEGTADFLFNAYREVFRRDPKDLREDFCGAFALCREWVRRDPKNRAIAVDNDPEPLRSGEKRARAECNDDEAKRLKVIRSDVRRRGLPRADIVCALNFSYWIFKERKQLGAYFARCREAIGKKGILVLDCLGGTETTRVTEDETGFPGFTYFWEQARFDPITRHVLFHIHFKLHDERKRRDRVFTYDWRMWTVPELRDLLEETGFRLCDVYWEGREKWGGGGDKTKLAPGEASEAWVAYIVARGK